MVQVEIMFRPEGKTMQPKLVKRDAFTIVGYQFEATLVEVEKNKLDLSYFNDLIVHKESIKDRVSDEVIFIQSYPLTDNFDPRKDSFKNIIGFKVKRAITLPENMVSYTVPACHYMKTKHMGSPEEIHETHDYLYAFCEEHAEYTPLGFDLEEWSASYNPFTSSNEIDVYLAVR
ncbi:effector binding domain-containing protein [Chryseomicrobium sp. FSL W7-1435]|uniref:GyrI-like domain-containing protein n=1 Tax=Chryseomicrobium sp. FSL W7-1435 TaxID=2921704 RepID=UPI00315AF234